MTQPLRALYICYFGLNEPLVQTQVLPYLRELAGAGIEVSILTFEPEMQSRWSAEARAEAAQALRESGIAWYALPYHKRLAAAKVFDIVRGALFAARLARRESITLFHGRSHVGTAIGALAKKLSGGRLIFDIRGLLADEYAENGNWQHRSLKYRLTKAAERGLLRTADGFVVLTGMVQQTIFPDGTGNRPLELIPCCVDTARFEGTPPRRNPQRVVYAYSGALGGCYLIDETADLLAAARARDPRTFALILTMDTSSRIEEALRARGFQDDDFRVVRARPGEVPALLRTADAGVSVIRPSFARRASSPTKYAEYLAAGLPVIMTAGIGDLDEEIREHRVGVILKSLDAAGYTAALEELAELRRDPDLTSRCIEIARSRYDLHIVGGPRYERLYRKVAAS